MQKAKGWWGGKQKGNYSCTGRGREREAKEKLFVHGKRLKLKCDILPSTSAFKIKLRHYIEGHVFTSFTTPSLSSFDRAVQVEPRLNSG